MPFFEYLKSENKTKIVLNERKIIAITIIGNGISYSTRAFLYFLSQYINIETFHRGNTGYSSDVEAIRVPNNISFETLGGIIKTPVILVTQNDSIKETTLFSNASSIAEYDVDEYRFILPNDYDENLDLFDAIYNEIEDKNEFLRFMRNRSECVDIANGHR